MKKRLLKTYIPASFLKYLCKDVLASPNASEYKFDILLEIVTK